MNEKLDTIPGGSEGYDAKVERLSKEIKKAQDDIDALKEDTRFPVAARESVREALNKELDSLNEQLINAIKESDKVMPAKAVENINKDDESDPFSAATSYTERENVLKGIDRNNTRRANGG